MIYFKDDNVIDFYKNISELEVEYLNEFIMSIVYFFGGNINYDMYGKRWY